VNPLTALLAGLCFGLGLIVAGMADPAKVLGFLDLAGHWDPSLALVMAGAIAVAAPAYALAGRRSSSLLGLPLQVPVSRRIDRRLLAGSLLFGAGWGLAGICPGPSVVLLATGAPAGAVFFAAMITGMACFELLEALRRRTATGAAADA
jgi:uncharacterized membrane protein YedE/YeeE